MKPEQDGGASLTFDYDQMVDVPVNRSARAMQRLSPTMRPTGTGIFPSPYKYPANMRLRGPLRGLRRTAPEQFGSDTFQTTVAGAQKTACGEEIQHFKAKNYQTHRGLRCRRGLASEDMIPGSKTLSKQHLFEYSAGIKVPIQEQGSGVKPKNMQHPGLILPPSLSTTQCLFAFNPQKTGTPMRLQSVAGRVSPEVPRFVTH